MKTLTIKQLTAVLNSRFGALTPKMHALAETALREIAINDESRDTARRALERVHEQTKVRPEHERVLLVLTRPLAEGGAPAIEVYSDARVRMKITFEYERLPMKWQNFKESVAAQQTELFIIPDWLSKP